MTNDWRKHPYFARNIVCDCYDTIATAIDAFMTEQGYKHEKRRFLCSKANNKTIALFSHGGSGACAISHLMGLPFPYMTSQMPYDFTSVIIVEFPCNEGRYVYPRLALFNDIAHLGQQSSPLFQRFLDDRTI